MREVIDEILGKEKQAQRTVEEAKKRATEIQTRSETQASEVIAQARAEAQRLLRVEADTAREAARARQRESVAKAEEGSRVFLERQERNLGPLVEEVVGIVLTPEHTGD